MKDFIFSSVFHKCMYWNLDDAAGTTLRNSSHLANRDLLCSLFIKLIFSFFHSLLKELVLDNHLFPPFLSVSNWDTHLPLHITSYSLWNVSSPSSTLGPFSHLPENKTKKPSHSTSPDPHLKFLPFLSDFHVHDSRRWSHWSHFGLQ